MASVQKRKTSRPQRKPLVRPLPLHMTSTGLVVSMPDGSMVTIGPNLQRQTQAEPTMIAHLIRG